MHRRDRTATWVTIGVSCLLAIAGCGEDDPEKPVLDAAELTAMGWSEFESGDLSAAAGFFSQALERDLDHVPAHVGQGWSRLGLAASAGGLELALESLDEALDRDSTNVDAHAGRAAVLLALGGARLQAAITSASAARTLAPEYSFTHRPSFGVADLHLIEAFAHAGNGDWNEALRAGERLLASGLRADEPQTWIVEGTPYMTWGDAVLGFLEMLSNEESG
jgi:hypothetical protein